MSDKRYYIFAGDRTTADGVVRASSEFSRVADRALARDGDPVDCPACRTQGLIGCVGPRMSDSFMGKEYALSDDLCICNCSLPPTLVAGQDDEFQLVSAPYASVTR
jgi:uncharacterized Zn-binding protein involved in type VI secretion